MEHKDITTLATIWQLDIPPDWQEAEILAALSQKITLLLSREPETFFQIMYRLDIPEAKLNQALYATNPPDAIARLIWQRQWEKARSRKDHRSEDTPDDDLKW